MTCNYVGVDLRCESQIDVLGPKGVPGIRPYFETLTLEIIVYTAETQERLEKLAKNVEFRCPVMNLFVAADVTMDVSWTRRPALPNTVMMLARRRCVDHLWPTDATRWTQVNNLLTTIKSE